MNKTMEQIQQELSKNLSSCYIKIKAKTKPAYGKVMALVYKDARVDIERLNEVVGIFGWKREHVIIGDNNYCKVSIRNPETGEWVSKMDVGEPSDSEARKGEASDAFKRACFTWGIGLELYNAPKIYLPEEYYKTAGKLTVKIGYFKDNIRVPSCMVILDGDKPVFKYSHKDYKKENTVIF